MKNIIVQYLHILQNDHRNHPYWFRFFGWTLGTCSYTNYRRWFRGSLRPKWPLSNCSGKKAPLAGEECGGNHLTFLLPPSVHPGRWADRFIQPEDSTWDLWTPVGLLPPDDGWKWCLYILLNWMLLVSYRLIGSPKHTKFAEQRWVVFTSLVPLHFLLEPSSTASSAIISFTSFVRSHLS